MPDRQAPRLEPAPLRLLSLSVQCESVVSPTLVVMSFTNSTGQAVLQCHVDVHVEGDSNVWVVSSLRGTVLCDIEDPLTRAPSEVMRVLTELRAVGRTDDKSGRADV